MSDWLGIEARPKRGIMKKKPQRGKKHLVSDKEKSRLGKMFASMRQNNAPNTEVEVHDKMNEKHAERTGMLGVGERG